MVRVASSFRDPAGYISSSKDKVLRHITSIGLSDYQLLMDSGLYKSLVGKGLLVPHKEIERGLIEPEYIPYIIYPYEWCFSQLKESALAVLSIEGTALEHGMTLKDASAYNMQLGPTGPMLIDTLSFTKYTEGQPWIAYGQFCRHFLAPLVLASYCDIRLIQLLRNYIDGVPLDLAVKLLPLRSWFSTLVSLHLRLQTSVKGTSKLRFKVGRSALQNILGSLKRGISKLEVHTPLGGWSSYSSCSYDKQSHTRKVSIVEDLLGSTKPSTVLDLGANTGEYSKEASLQATRVLAVDLDSYSMDLLYRERNPRILPIVMDITNPSPGLGWNNQERDSFKSRFEVDLVLALALVHHLAISNNTPFDMIVDLLYPLGPHLVVEFIPKGDSMVKKLLASRDDIFSDYTRENFESSFLGKYSILECREVGNGRLVYLMERR